MPVFSIKKVKDRVISQTRWMLHVERSGILMSSEDQKETEISTELVKTASGAVILPYFFDKQSNRWKVVLVRQFRLAIMSETLEAPGGRIEPENADIEYIMIKELKEETGIQVYPSNVRLVFKEYIQSSIIPNLIFGAIVDISKYPAIVSAGKTDEGERTRVEVIALSEILKQRRNMEIRLDLTTSRLLDEVRKAIFYIC